MANAWRSVILEIQGPGSLEIQCLEAWNPSFLEAFRPGGLYPVWHGSLEGQCLEAYYPGYLEAWQLGNPVPGGLESFIFKGLQCGMPLP